MFNLKAVVLGLVLALAGSSGAVAQCGTQAPANQFCGNDTGAAALATWKSVPTGALSAIAAGTVLGNRGAVAAVPSPLTNPVLGIPGSSTGQVGLSGITSGTATLRAQAVAGSAVSLLPTSAGTLVGTASAPLAIDPATGLVSITGLSGAVLAGSGPAFTRTPVLGVAGTAVGSLGFQNLTSGTITLQPVTGALGAVTINIPAAAGTVAVSATAPLTLSAAGAVGITGTALTKTDDTNVTLTLGGTPANALVSAASLTLGWTGQLAIARGGTGQASASAAFGALAPTPSGAGTLIYHNGTSYVALAGNTTTTNCLQESAAGVPIWASCGSGSATITLASSVMSGFTNGNIVFNNAGVAGQYALSGTGSVAMTTSPALTTPSLGVATATSLALGGCTIGTAVLCTTGIATVSSNSATAFNVGPNGTTNPVFQIDASVASAATGLKVTAQAAGSAVNVAAISSGANESLTIDAKGSGGINIGSISTGAISLSRATTASAGLTVSSSFTATGLVGYAALAAGAVATCSQYAAATASTLTSAANVFCAETTTTFGATTTFDFSTFINTVVTLTGNITTQTLSNVKAGQSGSITFIQDATGSRTTVWNSVFKWAGGTAPVLSTTASAVDVLAYSCRSATFCAASLMKGVQ